MAKTQLTATQAFDLRQALHVAALEALMSSRRWTPGDLVFQGGTSLHLAYGSPRLSEDLDFLVNSALKLDAIGEAVRQRLQGSMQLPDGADLSVSKAKDGHNPHAFIVSIGGPNLIGGVRVKIELWKTDKKVINAVSASVAPVRVTGSPAAGLQAFVPTADLPEIYADKVFALAARPYLKPRDVFDLYWLANHNGLKQLTASDLSVRLATYPNESPEGWLEKAFARRAELRHAAPAITKDLQRWLPSSWPIDLDEAEKMVGAAINALEQGIDMMRVVCDERGYGQDVGGLGL